MEFIVLQDVLEGVQVHYPSMNYPQLPITGDVKEFKIVDDDGVTYCTGNIYNSTEATEEDFEEILEYMEGFGATALIIDGEAILG